MLLVLQNSWRCRYSADLGDAVLLVESYTFEVSFQLLALSLQDGVLVNKRCPPGCC